MIVGRAVIFAPAVWYFYATYSIDSWGLVAFTALAFGLVTSLGKNPI